MVLALDWTYDPIRANEIHWNFDWDLLWKLHAGLEPAWCSLELLSDTSKTHEVLEWIQHRGEKSLVMESSWCPYWAHWSSSTRLWYLYSSFIWANELSECLFVCLFKLSKIARIYLFASNRKVFPGEAPGLVNSRNRTQRVKVKKPKFQPNGKM